MNCVSIPKYFELAIIDIGSAIVLGGLVNITANIIAKKFDLTFAATIIIQFTAIVMVLYLLKHKSHKLGFFWRGENAYGLLFTAIFVASQKNLYKFFNHFCNHQSHIERVILDNI